MKKGHAFLLGLIVASLIIASWLSYCAYPDLFAYLRLIEHTDALHSKMEIVPIAHNRYGIKIIYTYRVKKKEYNGETILKRKTFIHPLGAEEFKEKNAQKTWKVWYNRSNPTSSTVERLFPWNKVFRTLIAWTIFIYFIFLKKIF